MATVALVSSFSVGRHRVARDIERSTHAFQSFSAGWHRVARSMPEDLEDFSHVSAGMRAPQNLQDVSVTLVREV